MSEKTNKIKYDPQTGGFFIANGLPEEVKSDLKMKLTKGWAGSPSLNKFTTPSKPSSSSIINSISGSTVKYPNIKIDRDEWLKYSPEDSTLETVIHDTLMKILKGDDYWKEDRETLIEYLSQVLYSIINPEAEELVKESLVEQAIQKLGNLEEIKKELVETKKELAKKDDKINELKAKLEVTNDCLRRLGEEIQHLKNEIDFQQDSGSGIYDDWWSKPFC